MQTTIVTLESPQQTLRLLPLLGGGIASWNWRTQAGAVPLLRPWDEKSEDRYTLACFPLVPWSNRITQGGFAHQGVHYPIHTNRDGEPYPIHGDGWLQPWHTAHASPRSAVLSLQSSGHGGNPYIYEARQMFELAENGFSLALTVTNRGRKTLPYGLGLHPYFPSNDATRLQARADGVWLSGADPIPLGHTANLPPDWNYNQPAPVQGSLIDNCFSGWDGIAHISYPDRVLMLSMHMQDCKGYSLLYRPPEGGFFCFEPITHPIDAFHMKGRPGLVMLEPGRSFSLHVNFAVAPI